jgi:cyclomaltodextrinase / maltogenic alpha-amylase / neopullulanase
MVHWRHDEIMRPVPDGSFETTLALGTGAYAYKFLLPNGDWILDPANPRTRACDGLRNSLLVVGGADEPVLHAPSSPWLSIEDDGRLCVRAGLRRGHGDRLLLRWDEGGGCRETPLVAVGGEDEHVLFEVHLPGSGRTLEYAFVLTDGRCVGEAECPGRAFRILLTTMRAQPPPCGRSRPHGGATRSYTRSSSTDSDTEVGTANGM